ncbi:MAG: hypothetical protein AB4352_22895 [Hormoscilla sp.]
MNRTSKRKLIAAATAASTAAVLASTVGIETALAATFKYLDPSGRLSETWTITSEEAETVEDLWDEILEKDFAGWSAKYGQEDLKFYRDRKGFYFLPKWWYGSWDDCCSLGMVVKVSGKINLWTREHFVTGTGRRDWVAVREEGSAAVYEPSSAIALGSLGAGLVASRLRRRS